MKRLIFSAILLLFVSACAAQQIQPSAPVTHYMPTSYEITVAKGITLPPTMIPTLRQKIQEYLDDKNYWNKNSRPVHLLIHITHIEEASRAAAIFVGVAAAPSILAADVTAIDGDNKEYFRISSKNRNKWFIAAAYDLNERLATYFTTELMEAIQRPYED